MHRIFQTRPRPTIAVPSVWRQRDGVSIDIDKMADSHLLATIRMLIRNNLVFPLRYYTLLAEARKRGLWTDAEIIGWRLLGVGGTLWDLIK
jgi:hypothetical protein